jgi:hypothetical protein
MHVIDLSAAMVATNVPLEGVPVGGRSMGSRLCADLFGYTILAPTSAGRKKWLRITMARQLRPLLEVRR